MLELRDLALGLVAPYLFIERIEKLLPGGSARKGGAIIKCAAEAAKVEQALRSAVEWHPHAVEKIDDARRGIAHRFHRRLVGQKIAAVNSVIKMLPGGIALAFEVL